MRALVILHEEDAPGGLVSAWLTVGGDQIVVLIHPTLGQPRADQSAGRVLFVEDDQRPHSARHGAFERLSRLVAPHREHHPLDGGVAGVQVPANLLHLDPRRLLEREAAHAGPERHQRERPSAQLVRLAQRRARWRRG